MPAMPTRQRPCSLSSPSFSPAPKGRQAAANTRRPSAAISSAAARICFFSAAPSGIRPPGVWTKEQQESSTSQAPLQSKIRFPVLSSQTTDIRFRVLSKGSSPTRRKRVIREGSIPARPASWQRAVSVGSPTRPPETSVTSPQREKTVSAIRPASERVGSTR